MPNFNDFVDILKNDLIGFAKENLEEYKDELIKDGSDFIERTKTDLICGRMPFPGRVGQGLQGFPQ